MTEEPTSEAVESLVLDLLEWVGPGPRPYAEVMEAWRTSCPRLLVWEEADRRGFVTRHHDARSGAVVSVSADRSGPPGPAPRPEHALTSSATATG